MMVDCLGTVGACHDSKPMKRTCASSITNPLAGLGVRLIRVDQWIRLDFQVVSSEAT